MSPRRNCFFGLFRICPLGKKKLGAHCIAWQNEDSAITRFYGCYVNSLHQIISMFSVSTATMNQTESGMYFDLIRKAVSGTAGKNLVTVRMEQDGEDQRLLDDVRSFAVQDPAVREKFYRKVIENAGMEGNYLILMAHDSYDVPFRSASGEYDRDASSGVFRYFICALCPVLDAESKLSYVSEEHEFHSNSVGQTVGAPVAGFLYPSFADRSTNLDKALYYMKNAADPHDELVEGLFGAERPMVDAERREAFHDAMADATDGTCDFTAAQALYQAMREKTEELKTSQSPEMDMLRPSDLRYILEEGGMDEGRAGALAAAYGEAVGKNAVLSPNAVMESGKFRMVSPEAKITVEPELAALVKMRTIDGRRYILIPVDGGVELNGISVF